MFAFLRLNIAAGTMYSGQGAISALTVRRTRLGEVRWKKKLEDGPTEEKPAGVRAPSGPAVRQSLSPAAVNSARWRPQTRALYSWFSNARRGSHHHKLAAAATTLQRCTQLSVVDRRRVYNRKNGERAQHDTGCENECALAEQKPRL